MAQFKAEIKGNRGSVSRLGHKTTGISSHTCGWDTGIKVEGAYDEELDRDVFLIWQTSGSLGKRRSVLIGKLVGDSYQSMENT